MRVKSNEASPRERDKKGKMRLIKVVTCAQKDFIVVLPFLLRCGGGGYGNKEVGPKIASLYSSMIRTHGFRGDLIAIIMPASVRALLLVYA